MTTLTERRAEFVYDAARLTAIAAQAPIVPVSWAERETGFRSQFLEVIERQCGSQRSSSPEDLHNTWMEAYYAMGWVYGEEYSREQRTHPDLVPYNQMGQLERDKDAVFIALCEIARLYIYDYEERPCSRCKGTGLCEAVGEETGTRVSGPCFYCGGTGLEPKTYQIQDCPGVKEGHDGMGLDSCPICQG